MGPVGELLELRGASFDLDPAANVVTFKRADGDRIDGLVESASPTELMVRVPMEAVTGPARVTTGGPSSNDHQCFVLFRPEAGIFFPEFSAGQSVTPVILLKQSRSDRVLGVVQDAIDRALGHLLPHGSVHHLVGIAQDDGSDGAGPIHVFIAIDIPDPATFGTLRIDGTHAEGPAAGSATHQLAATRYQSLQPFQTASANAPPSASWRIFAGSWGIPFLLFPACFFASRRPAHSRVLRTKS